MQRIKDLIKIKEIIDEHNKKIEESISQASKLKDELGKVNEGISDLKKSMNDLKFRHKDLENNFKESSGMIKGIKEEFDEELSELKVLKSKLQTSIIEKLSEDFRAGWSKKKRQNLGIRPFNKFSSCNHIPINLFCLSCKYNKTNIHIWFFY